MATSQKKVGWRFKAVTLLLLLWLALLPGFVQAQATPVSTPDEQAILRQSVLLRLDDGYLTKGEIDLPVSAQGPLPAVLMLGGSGQADMDGAGPTQAGWPVFRPYKEMLDNLVRRGFIVYKFNKRGLDTGGQVIDQTQSDRRTNEVLVKDASAAMRQFLADPRVDKQRVFLLGHSQGTLIAAQVAQSFPVKGLILTGTISDWKTAFDYQLVNRYMEAANQTDYDHDGKLSGAELTAATNRDQAVFANFREVQLLESGVLPFFSRPVPGQIGPIKSGLAIDKDKDGQLSIEQELKPVLTDQRLTFLNQPDILKNSGESGAALQSLLEGPQLEQVLLPLGVPVFFQHSQDDERFPVEKIQALTAQLNSANIPAVLNVYPGLTHAFVPGRILYGLNNQTLAASSVSQIVPAQLLEDQATWLLDRLKPSSGVGPKGGSNSPDTANVLSLVALIVKLLLKQ